MATDRKSPHTKAQANSARAHWYAKCIAVANRMAASVETLLLEVATMSLNTLNDLFVDELKDVLSAEKQLLKALPKMAKAATAPKLRASFEKHLSETEVQVTRLEQVFESVGKSARAKTCEAMKGLLEEGASIMEEDAEPSVKDAALIAAAQKVEHYEIATYGTLCTWAKLLGHKKALSLLEKTLQEEKATDEKLTALAVATINNEAQEV